MRMILAVFDALRTFDRACTRAELERETGCDQRAVENGLCGLLRRGLLIVGGLRGQRGTYELVLGAHRPVDRRGRYPREERHRAAAANYARPRPFPDGQCDPSTYLAARPSSHDAQPGALRTVVRGVLDLSHASSGPFPECALAQAWTIRKR